MSLGRNSAINDHATNEKNWYEIHKATLVKMESEAKSAKEAYECALKASTDTKTFYLFRPSQEEVDKKLQRAKKKEMKISLLLDVVNTPINTQTEFDNFIINELKGLSKYQKYDVFNGRTTAILNTIYQSLGGIKDGFFPQDVRELKEEIEKKVRADTLEPMRIEMRYF